MERPRPGVFRDCLEQAEAEEDDAAKVRIKSRYSDRFREGWLGRDSVFVCMKFSQRCITGCIRGFYPTLRISVKHEMFECRGVGCPVFRSCFWRTPGVRTWRTACQSTCRHLILRSLDISAHKLLLIYMRCFALSHILRLFWPLHPNLLP